MKECPDCGSSLVRCYPDTDTVRCSNWPRCRWMSGRYASYYGGGRWTS